MSAEAHEWALWHAVDHLVNAGEIATAIDVAWLSIIRSSDPTAGIMLDVQRAIRNCVIIGRPGLVEGCLESRAGEAAARPESRGERGERREIPSTLSSLESPLSEPKATKGVAS
jgi:hypothetical protein